MLNPESCPQCGGALEGAQGQVFVACPFCGVELTRTLSPIESMKRALEKRASVEPKMNALMGVYAEHLGAGRKARALEYYECFQYLVLYTAYEVEDLDELEAMATPLMRDVARQLDVAYEPPHARGVRITFETIDRLLE
ncbi:MAG: hypothetical protein RMA76_42715 [Deltaproteobacteria bacterium]